MGHYTIYIRVQALESAPKIINSDDKKLLYLSVRKHIDEVKKKTNKKNNPNGIN